MTHLLLVAAGSVLFAGAPTSGWGSASPGELVPIRVAVESDAPRSDDADAPPRVTTKPARLADPEERPRLLVPLYSSMATWQALDFISTQRGLKAGAQEGNPLMAPLGSTGAVIAVKAGVSVMTIYAAERLWKHNRKAAILMLIGVNVGYAAVVSHNFALAAKAPGTR